MTTQLVAEPTGPTADDIQITKNETADRIATGTITVLPFIVAFAVAGFVGRVRPPARPRRAPLVPR